EQLGGKLTEALGRATKVERPTWASKFTIQQRAVDTMHVGRCFVSGDAAHVHSPASGQGLNTGVQDAFNLAWKLAMVVHGHADASLLDTYDAERVPIGKALLRSTSRVMETTMDAPAGGSATDGAASDGGGDHGFMRQLIRSMSGLAIAYPDSPLTIAGDDAVGPLAGERLTQVDAVDAQSPGWTVLRDALRKPAWLLLAFGDAATDHVGLPSWLTPVPVTARRSASAEPGVWDPDGSVRRRLGGDDGDWILVRPDGYLSARGTGRAELDRVFADLGELLSTTVEAAS
ncbi:MAG: FAD-dependent monooxygenase, partial [Williamsia herbipolensis]|nr:FAD-dependent monooxygenase [Williamsia herbipolensis]